MSRTPLVYVDTSAFGALLISQVETDALVAWLDQATAQAKEHGRSMEAEVRDILTRATRRPHIGMALLAAARDVGGIEDLPLPGREDVARVADSE